MSWPKRALVVVHGIGVQQRGETRDLVVSALEGSNKKDTRAGYEREPAELGKDAPPIVRRVTKDGLTLDVYEVYWAPQASRKTTARSVLGWLLRNTFLPGLVLRQPSRKTMADVAQVGFLTIIVSFVLLMAVAMLGNLTAEASCANDPTQEACKSMPVYQPAKLTGKQITWGWQRQLADTVGTLKRVARLSDRKLVDLTPSHAADVLKHVRLHTALVLAAVVWLTAQILFRLFNLWGGGNPGAQLMLLIAEIVLLFLAIQLVPPLFVAFAWVLTATTQVLRLARNFLAESIGDVQVYVGLNENSEHFAVRKAIHQEVDRVFQLLAERGYEEIVVFGHSLGSVIAFDALDGLRFRTPPLLPKVKAFVTFGAAIEKVRYFFDQRAPGSRERAELAADAFDGVAGDRSWINIWYGNDVVANPITSLNKPGWKAIDRSMPKGRIDVPSLLDEAKRAPVLNLFVRRWRKPWPPVHSYYLKDPAVTRLLAGIALTPTFE